MQGFILPPTPTPAPQKRKFPPNPVELPPNQREKVCYVPEVYKMTNVLKDARENGSKINFPLRFSYLHLKVFSEISNLNWFSPERAKICLYLYYFLLGLLKKFQNSIKHPFPFIIISVLKK